MCIPFIKIHHYNFLLYELNPLHMKNLFLLALLLTTSINCYSGIFNRAGFEKELRNKQNKLLDDITDEYDMIIGLEDADEIITLDEDFRLDGNLLILNRGKLIVNGAVFTIDGKIAMVNDAVLEINNGKLLIEQDYIYEHSATLMNNAALKIKNSIFESSNQSWSVGMINSASFEMDSVEIQNGFITTGLLDSSSAKINSCKTPGEFLCFGNTHLHISNSDFVLYWLVLQESSNVDISFPKDSLVAEWILQDEENISGIPYSVSISNSSNVMWGIIAESNSKARISDSELRTIGIMTTGSDSVTIMNITNNSNHDNDDINISDRELNLTNCSVRTWSFYPTDQSRIYIESCVFGELLCQDTSRATVANSICDGTGGYLGTQQSSYAFIHSSLVSSQLICRDQSVLVSGNNAITGPEIDADESAIAAFINTETRVEPQAHSEAIIFELNLNPIEAAIDEIVPVNGTARIIKGPLSPIEFNEYNLYSSPAEDATWNLINNTYPSPVYNDLLAEWNTDGYESGLYNLKLVLYHSYEDSVSCQSTALLRNETSVEYNQNSHCPDISPNPVNDVLKINNLPVNDEFDIVIYNIHGEAVLNKTINGPNGCLYSALLPAGTYFIKIMGTGYIWTDIFIKSE